MFWMLYWMIRWKSMFLHQNFKLNLPPSELDIVIVIMHNDAEFAEDQFGTKIFYLFGRFWGHMYTHDIRTIWKFIVINVPKVISWTFWVTPHSLRVLITIEWGIAVCLKDGNPAGHKFLQKMTRWNFQVAFLVHFFLLPLINITSKLFPYYP